MGEKEFVFNIIVPKLELKNDSISSDGAMVEFEWGDEDEFSFDIKSDRINVAEFDIGYNIEIKRNVEAFIEKLESNPFKVTVLENRVDEEQVQSTEALQKVGEADCAWPLALVQSLKTNQFSTSPFIENYQLTSEGEVVGVISFSILLHFKCEEGPKRARTSSKPYMDKDGKLSAFKDVEGNLDPNDIFFVIGNPPSSAPMTTNIFGTCGGKGPCPSRFQADGYKFMQGTLVEDCKNLGGCGAPDCCENKADADICDEVLRDIKPKPPPGSCCLDPCEQIFGPISDSCEGLTCTDLHLPCHAEFHTVECTAQRKEKEKQKRKKKPCRCRFKDLPKTKTRTQSELIRNAIKNDRFENRKKEILYPHTNPAPTLLAPSEPIQQRFCPVCCENISWVPLYGACPKCGFRTKVQTPLEEMTYDETKTAQQILDEWKDEAAKFRKEKKISSIGACSCTPRNVCLNCQLRKLGEERMQPKKQKSSQKSQERSSIPAENAPFKESHQEEGDKEGSVDQLIDDALSKPEGRSRAKYKKGNYKIPNLSRVIEWCKRNPNRKVGSDSSLSLFPPSSCSDKEKPTTIPPDTCETNGDDKQAYIETESFKRKQARKRKREEEKKFAQKSKYFSKDEYPGVIVGHRYCLRQDGKIPRRMGWLWNATIDDKRRGWKPGAVRRNTLRVMQYFIKQREVRDEMVQTMLAKQYINDTTTPSTQHIKMPTIKVTKKKGQYHVTCHPMHDTSKPIDPADPRSKTLEFTIDKDPIELTKREVKSRLKKMGFKPCTCDKPIWECECRDDSERDDLEDALDELCRKLCVPQLRQTFYLSDTTRSESEVDMEFSPPLAILKQPLAKKPLRKSAGTQCDPEDTKITIDKDYVCQLDWTGRQYRVGGGGQPPPCRPPGYTQKTDTDQTGKKPAKKPLKPSTVGGKPDPSKISSKPLNPGTSQPSQITAKPGKPSKGKPGDSSKADAPENPNPPGKDKPGATSESSGKPTQEIQKPNAVAAGQVGGSGGSARPGSVGGPSGTGGAGGPGGATNPGGAIGSESAGVPGGAVAPGGASGGGAFGGSKPNKKPTKPSVGPIKKPERIPPPTRPLRPPPSKPLPKPDNVLTKPDKPEPHRDSQASKPSMGGKPSKVPRPKPSGPQPVQTKPVQSVWCRRKPRGLQDLSLMHVRFQQHDCDQTAAIACPTAESDNLIDKITGCAQACSSCV